MTRQLYRVHAQEVAEQYGTKLNADTRRSAAELEEFFRANAANMTRTLGIFTSRSDGIARLRHVYCSNNQRAKIDIRGKHMVPAGATSREEGSEVQMGFSNEA